MASHCDNFLWYALYVRPRYEKIVASSLESRGYEVFLPTYQSKRRWSDRTKVIELPLFAGYAFCKFDFQHRLPILTAPGVNFVVGFGQAPTPIDIRELEAVRRITNSGLACQPWPFIEVGHRVRIEEGSLAGLEGFVMNVKNSYRLVVSINLLGRSVSVELDRDCVKPISLSKIAQQAVAVN